MTMKRYQALCDFWLDNPPVEVILAAKYKIGRFAKNKKATRTNSGLPLVDHNGKPLPPTLDEAPGTMKDLFFKLKSSGRKSITLNDMG